MNRTSRNEIDIIVTQLLLSLGFSPKNLGYYYLRDGLILAVQYPARLQMMTKVFYPDIAKMHNTTGSDVERTIRFAIREWYREQSPGRRLHMSMAEREIVVPLKKPSNSALFRLLTEAITGQPVPRAAQPGVDPANPPQYAIFD